MSQPSEPSVAPWREQPNWYVTNGIKIVGPVDTRLLLRGIDVGKVTRHCHVAQHSWPSWREQSHIREIRALRRWQHSRTLVPGIEPVKQALRRPHLDASVLERVRSEEGALGRALELAIRATKASVALLHQPKPPHIGLVTSFARGPGMGVNLGEVVPWHDEARVIASQDRALLGTPETELWARASARRLSTRIHRRVTGVALVPIRFGDIRGLLELGRYDHTFRQSDLLVLEDLGSSLEAQLDRFTP